MIALADCAITVSDAKKAARWWRNALGFDTHTVGMGEHAIMVAPPGDRFVLHLCEGIEPVQAGNSGIAFMTDEIEEVVRRMEKAGVEFPEPFVQQAWGGMAKFADPDGNIFWLLGAPSAFVRRERARTAAAPSRSRRRSVAPKRTARPVSRRARR